MSFPERSRYDRLEIHLPDVGFHAVVPSLAELDFLRTVEAGELPCPHCSTPLAGSFVHEEAIYTGILLQCPSCQWSEG